MEERLKISELLEETNPVPSGFIEVSVPVPSGTITGYNSHVSKIETIADDFKTVTRSINQTSLLTYELQDPDSNNTMLEMTASGVKTLNIPNDSTYFFPNDSIVYVSNSTPSPSGVVNIVAPSGVSLNGIDAGTARISNSYGVSSLRKIKSNEWHAYGNSGYAHGDLNENAVAFWNCEDTTDDASGNGNNASSSVNLTYDTGYNGIGKCFSFNGTDSYVKYDTGPVKVTFNGSFSISFFFKANDASNTFSEALFDKPFTSHTSPYYTFNIRVGNNILYTRVYNSSGTVHLGAYSGSVIESDVWYHVVAVFDSDAGVLTSYLNKKLLSQVNHPIGSTVNYDTELYIGALGNLTGNSSYIFNGLIDNVRLYNVAIDRSVIEGLYEEYN